MIRWFDYNLVYYYNLYKSLIKVDVSQKESGPGKALLTEETVVRGLR
jgi:hypothetical protein